MIFLLIPKLLFHGLSDHGDRQLGQSDMDVVARYPEMIQRK